MHILIHNLADKRKISQHGHQSLFKEAKGIRWWTNSQQRYSLSKELDLCKWVCTMCVCSSLRIWGGEWVFSTLVKTRQSKLHSAVECGWEEPQNNAELQRDTEGFHQVLLLYCQSTLYFFSLCWSTGLTSSFTLVGLVRNGHETNYRSELSRLAMWCRDNNLFRNTENTKKRRRRVSVTEFLGLHITEDLSWTNGTASLAKKARQRLYLLCKLSEPPFRLFTPPA